ncbi:Protein of unknown function (DUF1759) [Popillia japonica]|uniref:DDE-1 domain-containing protein n=1 Tax=Popillia japonica TaxID=7064 RepID=A0AAW1JU35_POPJA
MVEPQVWKSHMISILGSFEFVNEDEEVAQALTDERVNVETKYIEAVSRSKKILNPNLGQIEQSVANHTSVNSPDSPTPTPVENRVKLPPLKLPEFHGEYDKRIQFSDTFKSAIHNNTSLSKVQKHQYLAFCLKGPAETVISGLSILENNYDSTWALLNKRYEVSYCLYAAYLLRRNGKIMGLEALVCSCSISSEKEVIDRSVHSAAIDVSSTSFDGLVPPSPEDSYATESDPDDREYNPSDKNLSSDNEDNTASATLTKSSEKTGNQDHNDNKGRSRKRKRNQEQWKRNIIKQSRNKGLEYTNWKGKKQPARHLKYPCLNCRIKTYKKKTEVKPFTPELFRQAHELMKGGLSIRRAAKELGFNQGDLLLLPVTECWFVIWDLTSLLLLPQEEVQLVAHCKELNKRFYGISFKFLRFLLFHYAESNKIPSPFNKDKMAAGKDFALAFMRRHKLTLRTLRKSSVARTMGFNRVQIGYFFENLKEAYKKYGFTPDRIFNVEETGVQTVPGKLPKIVSNIGQKEVSKNFSKPTVEKPMLLILDNHASHTTLEVVAHAKSNHVVMLSLPPHPSHKTQPLDRVFLKPLKSNCDQVADNWQSSHPGQTITVYDVAELFKTAYERTATLEKAIVSFRVTGIYPLDSIVFSEEDFLPSEVRDQNLDDMGEEHTLMVTFPGDDEPTANPEPPHVDQFPDDLIKEPLAILEPGPGQEPSTIPGPWSIRHPTSPISSITVANVSTVSAADIMPLPKLAKKRKRTKRELKSTILTSTSNKLHLEEKINENKNVMKQKSVKKRNKNIVY